MAKTAKERAQERKALGLCCSCNNPATHGVRCEVHWLAEKERARARREAKKAAGLCSICGIQAAAPGILDCWDCRNRQNEGRRIENPHVPFDKPWHQRNVEAGYCMTGGEKHGPPVEGHKLCQLCLDKKRNYNAARKAKGLCACGKPSASGRRKCQTCIDGAKKQRLTNIEAGLCADCGTCPPLPGIRACARCNERNRKKDVKRGKRIKIETRKHYGNLHCFCCHEGNPDLLELDHIHDDGAAHRRAISGKNHSCGSRRFYLWLEANNFPPGLQWACATCNRAKHWHGICPHQKLPTELLQQLRNLNDKIARSLVEV